MNFQNLLIFRDFPKCSEIIRSHTKIIVCVLFYVNMLDKTSCNLISPFSNDIFYYLVSTSDFNVKL